MAEHAEIRFETALDDGCKDVAVSAVAVVVAAGVVPVLLLPIMLLFVVEPALVLLLLPPPYRLFMSLLVKATNLVLCVWVCCFKVTYTCE